MASLPLCLASKLQPLILKEAHYRDKIEFVFKIDGTHVDRSFFLCILARSATGSKAI